LYNKSLINKLTKIRIVVKNVVLAFNSEEERKYLQYLMRKYAGKHVTDIAECKDGGANHE